MLRTSTLAQRLLLLLGTGLLLAGLVPMSATATTRTEAREATISLSLGESAAHFPRRGRWEVLRKLENEDWWARLETRRSRAPEHAQERFKEIRRLRRGYLKDSSGGDGSTPVPEPSTALLMMLGLAGLRLAGTRTRV